MKSRNPINGILPIGYIFEFDPTGLSNAPDLSTPEKVHAYFGYGTWESYGVGRSTMGAGDGYAVGSEGGEAEHRLTVNEIPPHEHVVSAYENHPWRVKTNSHLGENLTTKWHMYIDNVQSIYGEETDRGYLGTDATGGNASHNNLSPYRTVYRYRRIA